METVLQKNLAQAPKLCGSNTAPQPPTCQIPRTLLRVQSPGQNKCLQGVRTLFNAQVSAI